MPELIALQLNDGSCGETSAPLADRRGTDPTYRTTVLVVDDEEMVRVVARLMLEQQEYAVHCAASGDEALAWLEQETARCDVMLLDLTMEGMDGQATLAEIRRRLRPNLPAIISSGYDEQEVARRFEGCEGVVFLKKPYLGRELSAAVGKALAWRDGGQGILRALAV